MRTVYEKSSGGSSGDGQSSSTCSSSIINSVPDTGGGFLPSTDGLVGLTEFLLDEVERGEAVDGEVEAVEIGTGSFS